jgi:chemotaxis protein methyltransferase CheR
VTLNPGPREREFEFTQVDFDSLRMLVRKLTGITLSEAKRELVYGRLSRRLRHLRLGSFADYRQMLSGPDGDAEMVEFTNAVTTNLTAFFREPHHFEYLREKFLGARVSDAHASHRIRIWCAGCSTGEEAWSVAMSVVEAVPDWQRWDIRILATDLDTQVLQTCVAGEYGAERMRNLSEARMSRFFDTRGSGSARRYRVKPELAALVSFRRLNLMHRFPMHGPLDAIFCRNVVIYFDKETQRSLFARFAPLQRPGDLLFLGHSESLLQVSDEWTSLGRTIYTRGVQC